MGKLIMHAPDGILDYGLIMIFNILAVLDAFLENSCTWETCPFERSHVEAHRADYLANRKDQENNGHPTS